jgi:arginyl-tRNA synthetase
MRIDRRSTLLFHREADRFFDGRPCSALLQACEDPSLRSAKNRFGTERKAGVLPFITKTEAVGGYLNFFIDSSYYSSLLNSIVDDPDYGRSEIGKGKTVCLDFSSPNIAKRFHLGHLGTTVIGNSLRNIYNFCSYKTVAINHLGDWGTQFGKLIVAYKRWSSKERVDERGINELVDIYVRFNEEEKDNKSLSDEAREAFAQLENGNREYLKIWQYFKEISLREYQKTYDLLGITFDSYNGGVVLYR